MTRWLVPGCAVAALVVAVAAGALTLRQDRPVAGRAANPQASATTHPGPGNCIENGNLVMNTGPCVFNPMVDTCPESQPITDCIEPRVADAPPRPGPTVTVRVPEHAPCPAEIAQHGRLADPAAVQQVVDAGGCVWLP